jgi:hypothetical protein
MSTRKRKFFIDVDENEEKKTKELKESSEFEIIKKKFILPKITEGIYANAPIPQIISAVRDILFKFLSIPFTSEISSKIVDLIDEQKEIYDYYKQYVELQEEKYTLNLDFLKPFLPREGKEEKLETSLLQGDEFDISTGLNYILSKYSLTRKNNENLRISWNCVESSSVSDEKSTLSDYLFIINQGIGTSEKIVTMFDAYNYGGENVMTAIIKYVKFISGVPPPPPSNVSPPLPPPSSPSELKSFVSVTETWELVVPNHILDLLRVTMPSFVESIPPFDHQSSSRAGKRGARPLSPLVPVMLILKGCDKKSARHVNALVFDTRKRTVERFEPNGMTVESMTSFGNTYNYEILDKVIQLFFGQSNPPIQYIPNSIICPYVGPQYLEGMKKQKKNSIIGDPGGFCVAWSLFYFDARLSNPDIPADILVDLLLKKLGDKESRNIIRSYANFILKKGMQLISEENKNEKDVARKKIKEAREKIIVVNGTPWSVEAFLHKLKIKNDYLTEQLFLLEEKEDKHYETEKKELTSQNSMIVNIPDSGKIGSKDAYDDLVKNIKESINLAGKSDFKNIYFIGDPWFRFDTDEESKREKRQEEYKNLFENIDAHRIFVSEDRDIYPWILHPILGEYHDMPSKILDSLSTSEFKEIADSIESLIIYYQQRKKINLDLVAKILEIVNKSKYSKRVYEFATKEQRDELEKRLSNKMLQGARGPLKPPLYKKQGGPALGKA